MAIDPSDPAKRDGTHVEALLRADAYPHAAERPQLLETHISWVILTGEWAYKIKKPVAFDFIDASTLDRRRLLCDEELRLNRRLAPELYSAVVPIVQREGKLFVDGRGAVVDFAVRMKQFPATAELHAELQTGRVSVDDAANVAKRLAAFHENASVGRPPSLPAGAEHVEKWMLANFVSLAAQATVYPQLKPLEAWSRNTLRTVSQRLDARVRLGHIRECHGDLHSGNIVRFNGRLLPFDCLEFNPELRWIDTIDDVAFLFMDLIGHGRAELVFSLLSRYLETGGDYEGARLLRFYAVYRALVRAKVDTLAAGQSPERSADRGARMQRRIETAESLTRPNASIALILMHGVSGSGKTWLSERLIATLPAVRVRSDVERKRSANEWPEGCAIEGIYTQPFNRLAYTRALECAEHCLAGGFTTIVDATFLNPADFDPFRVLAARMRVPIVIVSCRADSDVLIARLSRRAESNTDASDADVRVLRSQLATFKALDSAILASVVEVDTGGDEAVELATAEIRARVASQRNT